MLHKGGGIWEGLEGYIAKNTLFYKMLLLGNTIGKTWSVNPSH